MPSPKHIHPYTVRRNAVTRSAVAVAGHAIPLVASDRSIDGFLLLVIDEAIAVTCAGQ